MNDEDEEEEEEEEEEEKEEEEEEEKEEGKRKGKKRRRRRRKRKRRRKEDLQRRSEGPKARSNTKTSWMTSDLSVRLDQPETLFAVATRSMNSFKDIRQCRDSSSIALKIDITSVSSFHER
ncbi:hypothetical protein V1478_004524 [Vespula squamosa]|uniref:Uncharacterized protein n=1 Tax=Vespula squamosa TaxID=30214 RepID=A0ABD2BGG1_VESSQ